MGEKSSAAAASKISSSSALATGAASSSSNRSSILKSSFAPSYLQLHLFASVIQSFDSQQLRIHDALSGRLKQHYSTPAGTSITCLDWGYYGASYREKRSSKNKKRKRAEDSQEDVVVAYGTLDSEVAIYSPAEGKIIGVLRGGHECGIKDFKFNPSDNLDAWSVGGDGQLVQWDLRNDRAVRTIPTSDASVQTLCPPSQSIPQIICASFSPYAVTIDSKDDFRIQSFDAFKSPVTTLLRSRNQVKDQEQTFLAADHGRYIHLYDCSGQKIVRTLIASGDVGHTRLYFSQESTEDELLAVVTNDGVIDLFWRPFDLPQSVNGDISSRRKQLTRKADATVKLVDSDDNKVQVSVFSACFDGPNLIVVSVDSGVNPTFQKVRWQDEGSKELLFGGTKVVQRIKSSSTLNTANANGVKDVQRVHMNESRTVVANGRATVGTQDATIEISSSEDEHEDEEDEVAAENESEEDVSEDGSVSEEDESDGSNAKMDDAEGIEGEEDAQDDEMDEEPSFGDLLAGKAPEVISIVNSLPTTQKALTKVSAPDQAMLPSGMSFGTVLAQSLRTNDQSLLETCLHVMDETVIQNTILRLDSSLAATLLVKLAERLADRPGRYGHLLTWVQSTMIAHGGAIAGQAGVAAKLRTLYQVLSERSRILPSILLLKGKLDMMNAQQTFRAQAEAHRKGTIDAPGAVYVEGEEENWSSDEDLDEVPSTHQNPRRKLVGKKALEDVIGESESSDDQEMPLANGVSDSDDEDNASDEGIVREPRMNGVVDDEAEESEEDDSESAEEQSGEENDEEEEEEEEEAESEEDDSMADFIDDGEINLQTCEVDTDSDEAEDSPPPTRKKTKRI